MSNSDNAELIHTLEHAAMWLGKMIADGAHQSCVLPRDCEVTLARVTATIEKLRSGCHYCLVIEPRYQEKGMTCPMCQSHGTTV